MYRRFIRRFALRLLHWSLGGSEIPICVSNDSGYVVIMLGGRAQTLEPFAALALGECISANVEEALKERRKFRTPIPGSN